MAAEFTGEEIVELCTGRLAQGLMPDETGSICSDTRQIRAGEWYIALCGHEFDGHDFLGDAYSAGAIGCIVEERGNYPIASTQFPLIAVDDTYDAMSLLARNWRKRLNPRVLAVTASPHEQSIVVDVCTAVLHDKFMTILHDEGNVESLLNAELDLPEGVQLLIAKVCPEELSQAELLGRALAPTVLVLSEEGFSHLRASNEQMIARAECDMLAHLEKGRGVGIVSHRAVDLLHRIKYHFPERTLLFDEKSVEAKETEHGVMVQLNDSPQQFPLPEECSAADLWAIVQVCRQLGLANDEIAERLAGKHFDAPESCRS